MATLTTRFMVLLAVLTPTPVSQALAQSQTTRATPSPQFPVTLAQAADAAADKAARAGASAAAGGSRPEASSEPGWSAPEIAEGQARCNAAIARHKAEAHVLPPMHDGVCGTPVPIEVTRVGAVSLSHPAIINCNLLGTLDEWLQGDVQPAARAHLGGPIVTIDVMSSYSCRNAYGRKRTHLSEHALANAIDIGSFRTSAGAQAVVLADWGMTEREIKRKIAAAEVAAKRLAEAKAQDQARLQAEAQSGPAEPPAAAAVPPTAPRVAHAGKTESADPDVTGSTTPAAPTLKGLIAETFGKAAFRSMGQTDTSALGLAQPSKLGGPKSRHGGKGAKEAKVADTAAQPVAEEQRKAFLHTIHTLACKRFGTVLGPEANEAHRNHFHLDLAYRPRNHFCE